MLAARNVEQCQKQLMTMSWRGVDGLVECGEASRSAKNRAVRSACMESLNRVETQVRSRRDHFLIKTITWA